MTTILVLLLLVFLLLTGIPIFVGLGLASVIIMLLTEGSISSVADTFFAKLDNGLLTAIPMFAFMAHVMIKSKVVDDLYDAANALVGHFKGGLGVATVLSCTIFAAISGSSVATALTIGSSAIPQMRRFGYRARDAYGVIVAGGTLGILIPPSGPLILYAIVSETSIGALFMAGFIPGILMALIFACFCISQAYFRNDAASSEWVGWKKSLTAIRRSFWSLSMPPLVLGGIYLGIFTASEAASVGCIYALLVGALVYRNFGLKELAETAFETVRTTTMLFMILGGAALFSRAVTIIRLPIELMEGVVALGLSPVGFLIVVMLVILVLGMFLETISIILITTPIVLPILLQLDVNLIWYGILLMINLELALITPPVGMNLFVIKGIANAPLVEVIRGSLPYVILMLAGLVLVMLFPELALWLPDLAGFGR
ncbi:TRAP transporter large permease subunit [Sneathiella chungangensis]|uniref:TRAP transporter large permease protein n=1 Tax=Sneathiella chungangensis TaxID=1418234 RepID=A0A845MIC7_9PROT|nr:TRAP transporter large permease [Sneathiella chungangensis]MZR23170.1 TRAP transporter large permease subunit [Sneathiella chungangensis]